MSGHEFEKQVRHKLDDLKMKPSAEAWVNIEDKLREKKRRVVPIFWLPLLLVGLAAGGYFIFRNEGQKDVVATTVTSKKENAATQTPQVNTPQAAAPEADAAQVNSLPDNNQRTNLPRLPAQKAQAPNAGGPYITIAPHANAGQVNSTRIFLPQANAQTRAPQASNNFNIFNYISNDKIPSRVVLSLNSKVTAKPALPKFETAAPKKISLNKKQSKWSYGLTGTAGISTVSEGTFFDLNKSHR